MLTIAEDRTTYPPDGQIPNLEDDETACASIGTRIERLLPADYQGEVFARLVTWSASGLSKQSFPTWADAIAAATKYAREEFAGGTDQRRREKALDATDLTRLGTAVVSTGRTDDPRIAARDKSRKWANCGLAAFQIRERLGILGGEPVRRSAHTYGAGQGDALRNALLVLPANAQTVLLLDCQFPQVHNFMIEVHRDGSRYLAQGYQGTYLAHWWLGLDATYSGTPGAEILALRERYGLGRPISTPDYTTLLDGLVAAISGGWPQAAAQWRTLPFNPDQQEVEGIGRRSASPTILIEEFEVRRPEVARAALGGGDASLSELTTRGLTTD